MTIINQSVLYTSSDVLRLDIIDFNRLNGCWKNTADALETISSWLTANGQGGFVATVSKIEDYTKQPERDDFPDWEHIGNHAEEGRLF